MIGSSARISRSYQYSRILQILDRVLKALNQILAEFKDLAESSQGPQGFCRSYETSRILQIVDRSSSILHRSYHNSRILPSPHRILKDLADLQEFKVLQILDRLLKNLVDHTRNQGSWRFLIGSSRIRHRFYQNSRMLDRVLKNLANPTRIQGFCGS